MKINQINNTSFCGYKQVKNSKGEKTLEFNYPHDATYNCQVKLYDVQKDASGRYEVVNKDRPRTTAELGDKITGIKGPFAYRYELNNKPVTEAGKTINDGEFNLVTNPYTGNGGSMKLVMPDINAKYRYDDDNRIIENPNKLRFKNFASKSGGTLASIERDLEAGKFDGYSRIISTPIFTDDSLSHHSYWNKNPMQMTHSLGNINNYTSMQKKMFNKGINWVADGAFVNEGLEGIHFKHVLKWGEQSPYFDWFRITGIKDEPLKLGILGKKNQEFTKSHIVREHGKTYIQIYDSRLATVKPNQLIEAYDKDVENPLDINTHNDTVVPYTFEIEPDILKRNMKDNGIKEKAEYNYNETRALMKTATWEAEEKFEGGFETWDANPDIAKLNYTPSNTDTMAMYDIDDVEGRKQTLMRKNFEVQDLAIASGQYWTRKTNQILNLHAAQQIGKVEELKLPKTLEKIDEKFGELLKKRPDAINTNINIINNIVNGSYELNKLPDMPYEQQLLKGLMDVPLDSIEAGDDISSVLASPLMSKRAQNARDLGKSRFETFKAGNPGLPKEYKKAYAKTDEMYTGPMLKLAKDIITKTKLPVAQGTNTSEYGKYVLPHITSEIARFAVIKGLHPDAQLKVDESTGEISYNYKELKKRTLEDIGVRGFNPEDEACRLADKLKSGMNRISDADKTKIAGAFTKTFANTDVNSFKIAQVLVDRTGAGLDWRLDAAKDIADMEALRNGFNSDKYTIQKITEFWKAFTQNVRKENPNSYIAAEITDIKMPEFLTQAGVTTTANYSYFFHAVSEIFSKDRKNFENGKPDTHNIFKSINDMQDSDLYDSLLYSYTFGGNHDKPRILHCLALDMGLFYADLTNKDNSDYRARAYRVIEGLPYDDNKEIPKNYAFNEYSSKAIAMGEALNSGFGRYIYDRRPNEKDEEEKRYITNCARKAVSDLVKGTYKGKEFDMSGFGVKPIDITIDLVLDQMEYMGYQFKDKERHNLAEGVFETVLSLPTEKLKNMMKMLVALPGCPTLFSGDDLGATGYEEKTKNIFVQNRNALHHEWVSEKPFIKDLEKDLKEIMALRSREELKPLNDGAIFVLNNQPSDTIGILRQSTDGAMTVSVIAKNGTDTPRISLHNGLPGKLSDGLKFFNADRNDTNTYIVRGNVIEKEDNSDIQVDHALILYHKPDNSR